MDLVSLLPLVQPLINKLSEGKQLRIPEATMILLYTMAEDSRETKEQMTKLREDFTRFNDMLHTLSGLVSELRSEVAYVKGRINS